MTTKTRKAKRLIGLGLGPDWNDYPEGYKVYEHHEVPLEVLDKWKWASRGKCSWFEVVASMELGQTLAIRCFGIDHPGGNCKTARSARNICNRLRTEEISFRIFCDEHTCWVTKFEVSQNTQIAKSKAGSEKSSEVIDDRK